MKKQYKLKMKFLLLAQILLTLISNNIFGNEISNDFKKT